MTTDATETGPIRVLMVDDHELMREAYGMLLDQDDAVEVIGLGRDGDEAVSMVEELRPDVVILDCQMPRLNGVQAAAIIRERHPGMAIVFLSAHHDGETVNGFLKGDLRGKAYLVKQSLDSLSSLVRAVKAVARGKTMLADEIIERMAALEDRRRQHAFVPALTRRESEVLACVARGLNNAGISKELQIQARTVERHIGSIFSKMWGRPGREQHARVMAAMAFLYETGALETEAPAPKSKRDRPAPRAGTAGAVPAMMRA